MKEMDKRLGASMVLCSKAKDLEIAIRRSNEHRLMAYVGEAVGEEPNVKDAALALIEAMLNVPEVKMLSGAASSERNHGRSSTSFVDPIVEKKETKPVTRERKEQYPLTAAISKRNPLAIVVGVKSTAAEDRLNSLGIQHEWIEAAHSTGQRQVDALAKRVRRTAVCAVMVARGVAGHRVYDKIKSAAQLGVVPFLAPKTISASELEESLSILEQRLKDLL